PVPGCCEQIRRRCGLSVVRPLGRVRWSTHDVPPLGRTCSVYGALSMVRVRIVSASDRGAPSMRQRRYDRENYRETIAYPDSTCSDEFRRWSTMDQNLFNDICLQQLTLSGVHEGETVVVLTRGAERAEYADAFLWAAQRLGAATFHMRLPSPDSASGAWAV